MMTSQRSEVDCIKNSEKIVKKLQLNNTSSLKCKNEIGLRSKSLTFSRSIVYWSQFLFWDQEVTSHVIIEIPNLGIFGLTLDTTAA